MFANHYSSLYWPPEPYHPTEPEAPEDVRKRELIYTDPVHQINLVAFHAMSGTRSLLSPLARNVVDARAKPPQPSIALGI